MPRACVHRSCLSILTRQICMVVVIGWDGVGWSLPSHWIDWHDTSIITNHGSHVLGRVYYLRLPPSPYVKLSKLAVFTTPR